MTAFPKEASDSTDIADNEICPALSLTEDELAALRKSAEADMKKHGFKTADELTAYYDSKRGY